MSMADEDVYNTLRGFKTGMSRTGKDVYSR